MGIPAIGERGFCALKLAQRLLDPVPAGNCKLQTLRQYFRLPEHGAHTALGDVQTVIDLMQQVLRPLAERRGLATWAALTDFAGDVWFPSRLPFGKFKGQLYQEAAQDAEVRAWLEWLAEGEEAAGQSAGDYQRESAGKDQEYDSTAAALEGKRELNEEETARLKQLWKKLVRMFHPDLFEHDPERRETYERLTQAINEARNRGDIGRPEPSRQQLES